MDCFTVVEFITNSKRRTEVDVVPICWLFEEAATDGSMKQKCYWPDKKINVRTKVIKMEKPESSWPSYFIRILAQTATYEEALSRLSEACVAVEEKDTSGTKTTIKRKKNHEWQDFDSDDEEQPQRSGPPVPPTTLNSTNKQKRHRGADNSTNDDGPQKSRLPLPETAPNSLIDDEPQRPGLPLLPNGPNYEENVESYTTLMDSSTSERTLSSPFRSRYSSSGRDDFESGSEHGPADKTNDILELKSQIADIRREVSQMRSLLQEVLNKSGDFEDPASDPWKTDAELEAACQKI